MSKIQIFYPKHLVLMGILKNPYDRIREFIFKKLCQKDFAIGPLFKVVLGIFFCIFAYFCILLENGLFWRNILKSNNFCIYIIFILSLHNIKIPSLSFLKTSILFCINILHISREIGKFVKFFQKAKFKA